MHNFTTFGFECVAPAATTPPLDAFDFGCALAVRGSKNLANGVKDLSIGFKPLPFPGCAGCQVHAGFQSVWQDVEEKVMQVLADTGCTPGSNQSSLLISGHSMGAAVGTLAMFSLQARGYSVEQAYSFASPRVGNAAFARAFKAWFRATPPMFRVTHSVDVATQVPPYPLYKHVSSEAYFPGDDPTDYVVCPGEEDRACQRRHRFWRMLAHWTTEVHCDMPLGMEVGNICVCPSDSTEPLDTSDASDPEESPSFTPMA